MKKLTVSRQVATKIKQGQSLLEKQDFDSLPALDQAVQLLSGDGQSLGVGYLSEQNKGIGWFVSQELVAFDQDFFKKLFIKAKQYRRSYYADETTTAFRLFNQEGDGFGGFTVDLYGEFVVFSWYNPFVFQIKETILVAFQEAFPEVRGGYEKIRFKGLDYESAHVYGKEAPQEFLILENGVSYQVFLNDGLMTGIFLDQHEVRGSLVEGLAAGKSLLNMFSYTAAFSVAAAMGGAVETTSVDLAKRSRELSEAHFVANGLALDAHRFVVMDVFDYYKYAKRHDLSYAGRKELNPKATAAALFVRRLFLRRNGGRKVKTSPETERKTSWCIQSAKKGEKNVKKACKSGCGMVLYVSAKRWDKRMTSESSAGSPWKEPMNVQMFRLAPRNCWTI